MPNVGCEIYAIGIEKRAMHRQKLKEYS